jgi:hypothetical protein
MSTSARLAAGLRTCNHGSSRGSEGRTRLEGRRVLADAARDRRQRKRGHRANREECRLRLELVREDEALACTTRATAALIQLGHGIEKNAVRILRRSEPMETSMLKKSQLPSCLSFSPEPRGRAMSRALWLAASILAFAQAQNSAAATLTYTGVTEALQTRTIATGSQGGGVTDADADVQHLLTYVWFVESQSLDFDTQTGAFALASAAADQATRLAPDGILSVGTTTLGVESVLGGIALAEGSSDLAVAFTVDANVSFTLDASVDCTGASCDAMVELIGPLGTGTLLLVSTQAGPAAGRVTATLVAGAPYLLTARSFGTTSTSGTAVDSADASYSIVLALVAIPEPGLGVLLAAGALLLAGIRAR